MICEKLNVCIKQIYLHQPRMFLSRLLVFLNPDSANDHCLIFFCCCDVVFLPLQRVPGNGGPWRAEKETLFILQNPFTWLQPSPAPGPSDMPSTLTFIAFPNTQQHTSSATTPHIKWQPNCCIKSTVVFLAAYSHLNVHQMLVIRYKSSRCIREKWKMYNYKLGFNVLFVVFYFI